VTSPRLIAFALLLAAVGGSAPTASAQSVDELRQRIEELERSTREQVEALKKQIDQQQRERDAERRDAEQREQTLRALQEQVAQQQIRLSAQETQVSQGGVRGAQFFDPNAGARQTTGGPPPFYDEDIPGNVYASKDFNVRLGGSLRLHVQHNDTPVGESVSSALLPNPAVPGGRNNAERDVFRAFASRSRLDLAVGGPEVLGGKTSGYFQMDFSQQANGPGEVNAVENNHGCGGRWRAGPSGTCWSPATR